MVDMEEGFLEGGGEGGGTGGVGNNQCLSGYIGTATVGSLLLVVVGWYVGQ